MQNGVMLTVVSKEGFISIQLPEGESTVTLLLDMTLTSESVEIDEKKYLTYHYGPLLLALDTHFGGSLEAKLSATDNLKRVEDKDALVHFALGDVHLVDFGSAGKNDPDNDLYTVYIAEK